ncbi:ABC transporter ATP-binding protein [Cellulomonas sp. SG140]|uniref:ABC transporter ATP-binding protein n=1 Tax=Cellulomonas sp. SG140 TaxID=2976536 RepID=UPI0021E8F402|nr:ABC transporter ATP-binding protein [Cellulomonas sp. SG140]
MADAAGAPILEVDGLVVRYGSYTAVDGLSLSVGRGEIFGLLGPNGAGKTSTLSAIEGLLNPAAGAVTVVGHHAATEPLAVRALIGVQLQASSFQAELTLTEILRLYSGLYGLTLSADELSQRLRRAGLADEANKRYKQTSGGQQQRFSLLVAMLHDPPLLLLDEPTSGLDPQARRQLWSQIERARGEGGSILLTTHSMEEAQAVCDRVAIIDHGTLVALGTPAELVAQHRTDPRVLRAAHGEVTLEDVFIGLTGDEIRD